MKKYNSLLTYTYRNLIPQLWQDRVDLARGESQVFRPCFQPTKTIFIHIPKAAGTSIARAIYGQNVGHRKAQDYIAVSCKEFNSYYSYSFTRNPWDRLVSAYNFVKQWGTELVQPLPNPIYQSSSFRDFETFVTEWLPHADLSKEDVVFEPQHKYIYDRNDQPLINHVGKIEQLSSDIEYISKKIGMPITVETLNSSNRVGREYRAEYNDKMEEIVSELYAKDITLFGYKF